MHFVRSRNRRRQAQSIVETVVGIIFLIPIVLFLFDMGVLILCNTANDALAKQVARAAAGATDPANNPATRQANAKAAADAAIARYNQNASPSGFMRGVTLVALDYNDTSASAGSGSNNNLESNGARPATCPSDPGPGNCQAVVSMQVVAPVPFPGFNINQTFFARAVEPITSVPP